MKLRRDLMFARRHCALSFSVAEDAWQRETARQDNCQGSATIFITRTGGRKEKS